MSEETRPSLGFVAVIYPYSHSEAGIHGLGEDVTASSCPLGFHHCTQANPGGAKGQELVRLHGAFCDRDDDCFGDDGWCVGGDVRTGCVTAPTVGGISAFRKGREGYIHMVDGARNGMNSIIMDLTTRCRVSASTIRS